MLDDCPHTLQHLVSTILPEAIARLEVEKLIPMASLMEQGRGVKTIAKALGRQKDFSGLYVLYDGDSPHYVGISRQLISRLRSHVASKTHFSASLAYRMACEEVKVSGTRDQRMNDKEFLQAFDGARATIAGMSIKILPVEDPITLYLLEVWVAMTLGTHKWNSFKTH